MNFKIMKSEEWLKAEEAAKKSHKEMEVHGQTKKCRQPYVHGKKGN